MEDLGVIDGFTETFSSYIDSGFGLLAGEVAFLTSVLIAIDITLAGLFWALSEDRSVIPAFLRKVLYVGAFALIIGNLPTLAGIVFDSFAGLGLTATGTSLTAEDLMRPGFVAAAGFDAARPLLEEAGELIGPIAFFENFVQIAVLLFAWLVVLLAFFILAIQLFITIIEFKLTTLAGFVLVPFALWGRTAFLAERVLGNVVSAGIKLMVLAVIIGIGATLFGAFAASFTDGDVSLEEAASTVLGAIALLGLGIFGPGIASGLVSGAPQLGAGAAVGTAGGLAAGAIAGGAAAAGLARAGAGGAVTAVRAGASLSSGTASAYRLGQAASGAGGLAGMAAGARGVMRAGAGGARGAAQGLATRLGGRPRTEPASGGSFDRAAAGTGRAVPSEGVSAGIGGESEVPAWARRLQGEQRRRARLHSAGQAVKEGDRPGAGANPDLSEKE